MSKKVAVAKGRTRYESVKKALEYIKDEVVKDIYGKNNVIIKPNLVSSYRQLASTHIDTIKAIFDFIKQHYNGKISIAEGSATNTGTAFKNFGYIQFAQENRIELFDLNQDDYKEIMIYDNSYNKISVRISKKVLESDYRISSAILKTHDTVIATLSIKNMVVGSILQADKHRIHQGYRAINLNIYKMAKYVWPQLAIIDGFIAMEGDGPVSGTPVEMGAAIVSTDPLAADTVGVYIMGFNPDEIGYLHYLKRAGIGEGNLDKIEILGEKLENVRRQFKPHTTYSLQRKWKIEDIDIEKMLH